MSTLPGLYAWHQPEQGSDDGRIRLISSDHKASNIDIHLSSVIFVDVSKDIKDEARLYYSVDLKPDDAFSRIVRMVRVKGLPEQLTLDLSPSPYSRLPESDTRRTIFIISTGSGTKQAAEYFRHQLKPTLDASGLFAGYDVFTTESVDSITNLANTKLGPAANKGIHQIIVLLSGDGGPIDLVNAFWQMERSPEFARPLLVTLPLGTGNALSNSYGYNKDKTGGLSTLFRGKSRPLPSFHVTFSSEARLIVDEGRKQEELPLAAGWPTLHGLVVCSWGLHSTLVADSDTAHYRQFGAERFGMVAKLLLYPENGVHHGYKGRVSVQEESSSGRVLDRSEHSYILATLVSNLEQTFCISPDSKRLDGKLRLVEMPSMDGAELMKLMEAGYQDGKHVGMPKVGYHQIESMRIDFEEPDGYWRRVCVDGKIVQVEQGGHIEVSKDLTSLVDIASMS